MSIEEKIINSINEFVMVPEGILKPPFIDISIPGDNIRFWIADSQFMLMGEGHLVILVDLSSQSKKSKRIRKAIQNFDVFNGYTVMSGKRSVTYRKVFDQSPAPIAAEVTRIIKLLFPGLKQDLIGVTIVRRNNWATLGRPDLDD